MAEPDISAETENSKCCSQLVASINSTRFNFSTIQAVFMRMALMIILMQINKAVWIGCWFMSTIQPSCYMGSSVDKMGIMIIFKDNFSFVKGTLLSFTHIKS